MAFPGAMASDTSELHHSPRAFFGLFGNISDLAPNLEITVRICSSRTFSCIPRTPVTVKDHQPQDGGRRASKRVWFAAFWARCPPVQRPVRSSAVQKASLMPARAMASPLRSMCLANKANGGHRMAFYPASVASWHRRRTGERQAMVFRNSQSTGSNGSAGKVEVAGAARDGPSEAGTARIGESLGEG
ncbi:hypothetical protein F5144DRAFT_590683 [Chaetomium tenue]|uniref:Uncharacterized protein n=1 Tax=Chaetomium tenue TaxID=1854479 RepID=A0ACB7PKX6_9PEZI|nr:hypothetical protein F5144DRAFT_590683 [Chaetomium globosum]